MAGWPGLERLNHVHRHPAKFVGKDFRWRQFARFDAVQR
jgi:hypothetical protein